RSWVPRRPTSLMVILSVLCDHLRSVVKTTSQRRFTMLFAAHSFLLVAASCRSASQASLCQERARHCDAIRMPIPSVAKALVRTRGRHEEVEVMVPAQWTAQPHHLHETADADCAVHDQHGPAREPTVQRRCASVLGGPGAGR